MLLAARRFHQSFRGIMTCRFMKGEGQLKSSHGREPLIVPVLIPQTVIPPATSLPLLVNIQRNRIYRDHRGGGHARIGVLLESTFSRGISPSPQHPVASRVPQHFQVLGGNHINASVENGHDDDGDVEDENRRKHDVPELLVALAFIRFEGR